jgi:hypothetical protein
MKMTGDLLETVTDDRDLPLHTELFFFMKLHAEFFLLMIGFNVFVFLCAIHNGDYQFDY